jgi:hypothetical protein
MLPVTRTLYCLRQQIIDTLGWSPFGIRAVRQSYHASISFVLLQAITELISHYKLMLPHIRNITVQHSVLTQLHMSTISSVVVLTAVKPRQPLVWLRITHLLQQQSSPGEISCISACITQQRKFQSPPQFKPERFRVHQNFRVLSILQLSEQRPQEWFYIHARITHLTLDPSVRRVPNQQSKAECAQAGIVPQKMPG